MAKHHTNVVKTHDVKDHVGADLKIEILDDGCAKVNGTTLHYDQLSSLADAAYHAMREYHPSQEVPEEPEITTEDHKTS